MQNQPLQRASRVQGFAAAHGRRACGARWCPAVAGLMLFAWVASSVIADPLPGEIRKFDQQPELNLQFGGAIWHGHDEASNAYQTAANPQVYTGTFMADDFADKFSTPVVHISWWGSYLNTTSPHATQFLVSFESDVPASPAGGFSTPGTPLLNQIVTLGALAPASGTFTETVDAPTSVDGPIYKYNAELAFPFAEQPNTVYWLKIAALWPTSAGTQGDWGWHNRDYTIQDALAAGPPVPTPGEFSQVGPIAGSTVWHFQDDAVTGQMTLGGVQPGNPFVPPTALVQSGFSPTRYLDNVDGPQGIGNYSKDLAFQLYTVPEPSALLLMGVVGAGLSLRRGNRRRG